jgi:hypothetical protein
MEILIPLGIALLLAAVIVPSLYVLIGAMLRGEIRWKYL